MNTINRALVTSLIGGAALGAALTLAGPASADPTPGAYTGTMLNGGGEYQEGDTQPFTVNPCGPDCVHVSASGPGWNLHRQGNLWIESTPEGTTTLDGNTLILDLLSAQGGHVVIGLAKNG